MAAATPPKARKATKRATAPRKVAATRAKPKVSEHLNGSEPEETLQPVTPPEQVVAKKPAAPTHPYGNVPVYVFKPSNGGAPIVFPKISTLPVTTKFMWSIYNLNEMFQSFEWMNLAKVPRDIQERVIDLPLPDRQRFWSAWFKDITGPMAAEDTMTPPGES